MDKERWTAIKNIDLEPIKAKLRKKMSWWWKWKNNIDKLEGEYRQFLYLVATNQGKSVVPWTQALDDFWHEHILHTTKYKTDCETAVGFFVDHDPHVPKGTPKHSTASSDTRKMYREAFSSTAKKREKRREADEPGCSVGFIPVFCATPGCITYSSPLHSVSAPVPAVSCSSASCYSGGSPARDDSPSQSVDSGSTSSASSCSSGSSGSSSSCSSSSCSSGSSSSCSSSSCSSGSSCSSCGGGGD